MTGESQPSLDLTGSPASVDGREVLVPIHADNWALALASGYLGGSLKDDSAADLQSLSSGPVFGFSPDLPRWALDEGEPGPRVLLKIRQVAGADPQGPIVALQAPLRITRVEEALFLSVDEMRNFHASYDLFPDVPSKIVPTAVHELPIAEVKKPTKLTLPAGNLARSRADLDFFGGWAVGILENILGGEVDEGMARLLRAPPRGLDELADRSLRSIDPDAGEFDMAIWAATVRGLRSRYGKKGFDRQQFLAEIIERAGSLGEEATRWAQGCARVIDAEIEVPTLEDGANLGRRAALAVILTHEPRGLADLDHTLGAGPRVHALVTMAVYAFAGLSRLDATHKSPAARFDAVLSLSEALLDGRSTDLAFEHAGRGPDLSRSETVKINGHVALQRIVQPPPYLLMLKARAQEAGYVVKVNELSGKLLISAKRARSPAIMVEQCAEFADAQPVINLVLPMITLGSRPTTAMLKSYLELAWKEATTIGLREVDGRHEVCAVASIQLATLDRDELVFHVEKLLALGGISQPKKRRGKATNLEKPLTLDVASPAPGSTS